MEALRHRIPVVRGFAASESDDAELRGFGLGARIPANPYSFVYKHHVPRARWVFGDPGSGKVRARLPAKPLFSVSEREPWAGNSRKAGLGCKRKSRRG